MVKISADSTCDLSPELLKRYDVAIQPLYIVRDDASLRDGVDIRPTDIFAYVSGLLLGGKFFTKKLIPHISPKKTWEGIIGSWLLTNAAGIVLVFPMFGATSLSPASVLMLVLGITLIFILAVYGDLAGSLVKRSLSVKDSGSLLPGIGGLFDLIDSPSFTVPFLCILMMTVVY